MTPKLEHFDFLIRETLQWRGDYRLNASQEFRKSLGLDLMSIPDHAVPRWDLIDNEWVRREAGTPFHEFAEFEDVVVMGDGKVLASIRVRRVCQDEMEPCTYKPEQTASAPVEERQAQHNT